MPSSWTQNYYHIVTSTDHRVPCIYPEVHERLYAIFGGIAKELDAQLIAGNGMPDHAHLLLRFPSDLAPAVMAGKLKSQTSSWISENFPRIREFSWQRGYGGFTVSHSNVPVVEEYIRNQQEHHRKMTFAEEFEELLKRHGIKYDPKYLVAWIHEPKAVPCSRSWPSWGYFQLCSDGLHLGCKGETAGS